jgi:transposase
MPIKISNRKIEQIFELYKQGIDPREIATAVGVGTTTVYKILRNYRFFNAPRAPKLRKGRPPKITADIAASLEDFYAKYQTKYLDEAVAFIKEEFNVTLGKTTVWDFLQKLDLKYKKASILILERLENNTLLCMQIRSANPSLC